MVRYLAIDDRFDQSLKHLTKAIEFHEQENKLDETSCMMLISKPSLRVYLTI